MSKAESRSGKRKAARKKQPVAIASYGVSSFCNAHGISESFYYKLREDGLGPVETRLGTRVLISQEAAARWRAEREAETMAKRKAEAA
jgi:hypothetical protein